MRPARRRHALLAIAAAVAIAPILAAVVVRGSAASRWQAMQQWLAAEQRAWDAREGARPVLHGTAIAGSAFEHYAAAAGIAQTLLARDDALLVTLRHREHELSEAERDGLHARWAPAVDAMLAGARCSDARSPRRLDEGFPPPVTSLLAARWIANMACDRALRRLEQGAGTDAVGLTLDTMAFGADHADSPMLLDQMIGLAIVAIAAQEFWGETRLRVLDPAGLDMLAEGLARLDAGLPTAVSLRTEIVLSAHALAADLRPADGFDLAAWRQAFSARARCADAVLRLAATVDELDRSLDRPWPERKVEIDRASAQLESCPDPIVRTAGWPQILGNVERMRRQVVVKLRMLRAAVDLHRGRPGASLDDALGDGPLEIVATDGGWRILSDGEQARGGRIERRVDLR